ncbi:MAG TPA: diaminopimelate epimerase [Syntrophomonadaceae bacterium]|nr:diaminopimelate epimerase [Syntrophomonadaceae bacterium]
MEFTKWHGLGNDFILMELSPDDIPQGEMTGFVRRVCHRKFGIGGDGLVFVYCNSHKAINMRIFNADGSEPEMCGNAIRCVAKYVYTKGLVKETTFPIQTKAGIRVPEVIIKDGEVTAVKVDMGEPILESELIPFRGETGSRVINEEIQVDRHKMNITAVSMGNPHCMVFIDGGVDEFPVHTVGPCLECHQLFPAKTNVEFVEVLGRDKVNVRVWERGVGETLACGTGACAVAVGGSLSGHLDRDVQVSLPGGRLFVEWGKDNHVYMTGPAEEVFSGRMY